MSSTFFFNISRDISKFSHLLESIVSRKSTPFLFSQTLKDKQFKVFGVY